jgi:hypothetical protein
MATISVSFKRFCDVVKVVIVQKNNLTKFGYYLFYFLFLFWQNFTTGQMFFRK